MVCVAKVAQESSTVGLSQGALLVICLVLPLLFQISQCEPKETICEGTIKTKDTGVYQNLARRLEKFARKKENVSCRLKLDVISGGCGPWWLEAESWGLSLDRGDKHKNPSH